MLTMEIIEVFLNTFALDYSSKPETIMRQLRITANKRKISTKGGETYIYEKHARTRERKLKQYGSV